MVKTTMFSKILYLIIINGHEIHNNINIHILYYILDNSRIKKIYIFFYNNNYCR